MSTARPKKSNRFTRNIFSSHKSANRPASAFSHSNLVPDVATEKDLPQMPSMSFGAPSDGPAPPRTDTVSPVSVFDNPPDESYQEHPALVSGRAEEDDPHSYDLNPPPPKHAFANIEDLSLGFFSVDHLNIILRDRNHSRRFRTFVTQFKPGFVPLLNEYIEIQKAIAAVEYANALAVSLHDGKNEGVPPAAMLDKSFEARVQTSVQELVADVLPAYNTHILVQMVTDTLVKEITGHGTPLMREMLPALAEVYCIADPSLPDNPIVYASEEFYNTSQYSPDYVIGRNCRFLQGPKTAGMSVKRMIDAMAEGREVNETILNYRRDGSPFLNLLLIAPLYDNKGNVRYFLGAQVDVSSFIEDGRGFESFEQLLARQRVDSRLGNRQTKKPNEILAEISAMLDEDEMGTLGNVTPRASGGSVRGTPTARRTGRRILGQEDEDTNQSLWPDQSLGPSGRLPGVYQNYLLVRPFPSLRITFTSPALRIPGLLQTKFMERIGGPSHVREGIIDAMQHGTSITAKVRWMPIGAADGRGGELHQRWIHCTPLLGSDDKVGVWMVVMVEHEEITGRLNRVSLNSSRATSPRPLGVNQKGYTSGKLYQEYLRREGRDGHVSPSETSSRG